jgi:uncharacterized protein YigA (DUF484 family)
MTISQVRGVATPTDEEDSVARYLQQHPDFFERNLGVLARLKLPHVRSGSTISLVERQVEVLRERQAAAEAKLAEFVRVARSNDVLADKIHRFTRRLLRAGTLESTLTELEASLREDFDAFNALLVLVDLRVVAQRGSVNERFIRVVAAGDPNLKSFDTLFASGKPRCGQVRDTQRAFLFGAEAGDIGSVALVPLGRRSEDAPGPIGLLVLGSHDRERFHPGMSTEFLARMGELVADALSRPHQGVRESAAPLEAPG